MYRVCKRSPLPARSPGGFDKGERLRMFCQRRNGGGNHTKAFTGCLLRIFVLALGHASITRACLAVASAFRCPR
eukprot:5054358-Pyramimonas_sp.AAC.1